MCVEEHDCEGEGKRASVLDLHHALFLACAKLCNLFA